MYPKGTPLRSLCEQLLKGAARQSDPPGKVYTNVQIGGRRRDGLDLLLEEPDRIVVISFCCDGQNPGKVREEFLLFDTGLTLAGIHKKLHFVLFHDQALRLTGAMWPTGVSFSAIALPLGMNAESLVDETGDLAAKIGSILYMDRERTKDIASGSEPMAHHDWQRFLTPEAVIAHMRAATPEGEEYAAEMETHVHQLFKMIDAANGPLEQQVVEYMEALWRKKP